MIEKAEQTRNTKKSNNTNHDKRATQKSLKKKENFVEDLASGAFQWQHCIKKCIMPPTASNINAWSMIQSRHL